MTFAITFKDHREARWLTRRDVAIILGCSVGTVRDWEQGVAVPPAYAQADILKRLSALKRDHIHKKKKGKKGTK